MAQNWFFLRTALKDFRSTGAIASSSKALVKKLVAPLPTDRPLRIVELGPGNGCVTEAILGRVHADSEVTAFEINPTFVEELRGIQDRRLTVRPVGAEQLLQFYAEGSVDYVISSLPLSMIPKEIKSEILRQSQLVLAERGQFIQYQYALQDRSLLKRYFGKVTTSFTMANLPPAFIYCCFG
ncbi:class I SAM-dependent methyltransferase [Lewinella sp. 4G2]|uniref:class I SAM-dependent methyltransferase n=1 Tax=Lewinella sp. 4G2 TaxID=1803372 RepID=UPI0007B4A1D8|nr:methyltransferase domain-containing protein [Lewinella sp. 4G2]OAV46273.1 hypothetical protein A3850_018630 [Lewinella sp. 4G2]